MKSRMNSRGALACALAALAVAACTHSTGANDFKPGLTAYLADHGNICLGKPTWPIDVAPIEFTGHARNGIQMPALERLGLVVSSDAAVTTVDKEDGTSQTTPVKRYALTDEGRKYYREGVSRLRGPDGTYKASGDFCAATLSLDKVVGWTPPAKNGDHDATDVTYTYKIDAAPWVADPLVQQAFPVVANLVAGAGKTVLTTAFVSTSDGWRAADSGRP